MLSYLLLYCFTKVGKLQLSLMLLCLLLSEAHILSERASALKILFTHRILSRRCCQSSHHSCHTPGSKRYSDHSHIWSLPGGRWVLACGTCAPAHRTHPRSRCRHRRQSHVTRSGRSGRWTDVAGKAGTCSPAHRCCLHSRYDGRTWYEEQRKLKFPVRLITDDIPEFLLTCKSCVCRDHYYRWTRWCCRTCACSFDAHLKHPHSPHLHHTPSHGEYISAEVACCSHMWTLHLNTCDWLKKTNKTGVLQEVKYWMRWPSVNLHILWIQKHSKLYFKTCSYDHKFFIRLMWSLRIVWSESPTALKSLASGILFLERMSVKYKNLDPPWARKPKKGDMHKVASEAGEIRNVSSLDWRPSTGHLDAGSSLPLSLQTTLTQWCVPKSASRITTRSRRGRSREVVENKRMVFEVGWGGKEVRRCSKIIKQNYQLVA